MGQSRAMRVSALALFLVLAGCGGRSTSGGGGGGSAGGGGSSGGAGTQGCSGGGMQVLGISILPREGSRCVFTLAEVAQGVSIGYQVVIEADVPDVVVQSQTSCGAPGPSGLDVFEQISGSGQSYCICDTGLCPPPPDTPQTLKAGTYPGAVEWDGRNWSGPSDTGSPKGPPFPAGTYALVLSGKGTYAGAPFDARFTYDVKLLP